ncbi:MAG TPA: hypothetical protein VF478_12110, partial [Anaerolineae bacterium]
LLLGWLCVHSLGYIVGAENAVPQSRAWIDEWLFGRVVAETLRGIGFDEGAASQAINAIKFLTAHPDLLKPKPLADLVEALVTDDAGQQFLGVHRWDDVLWFNKEPFDLLLAVIFASEVVEISAAPRRKQSFALSEILDCFLSVEKLQRAQAESKFQVEGLLAAARTIDAPKRRLQATQKKAASRRGTTGTRTKMNQRGAKKKKK